MEARVAVYGLRNIGRGHKSARELMDSAIEWESKRYERFLWFLATLGNNAPFFGLFGTVLGVIMAFDALGSGTKPEGGGSAVMGPIAEALIATGVGLIVAIPAVVAFNIFKQNVKAAKTNTELLTRTLVAHMFSEEDK
jgi:biopolymer transport protein ExbB